MSGGGMLNEFAPWAKYLIVINTLLVVFNSSINFAFYCGDVVFRECLSTMSRTIGCQRWTRKGREEANRRAAEVTNKSNQQICN